MADKMTRGNESGLPLHDSGRFQQLTSRDAELFGRPEIVRLDVPTTDDPIASVKRERWFTLRGAPQPAERHSEYLYIRPGDDDGDHPRILISAVLDVSEGSIEDYLSRLPGRHRHYVSALSPREHGYTTTRIDPADYAAEIAAIIRSSDRRQGRQIAEPYRSRPEDYDFPDYGPNCDPRFRDLCFGVLSPQGRLVAYLLGKRIGDHVYYDEIMGHADALPNGVMYLLHRAFLEGCLAEDVIPRCLHYGPWYSGAEPFDHTKGLNLWKRRTGFRPAYLTAAYSSAVNPDPEPRY